MLTIDKSLLLVVDVQESLAAVMFKKEEVLKNVSRMIEASRILGVPILWSEQAPQKIGKTVPFIAQLLKNNSPIEKITFSCCGDANFMQAIGALNRRQVLIVGIETHVCVYQTARDLINLGYDVEVVADAVSSRTEENKIFGLERIKEVGASLTSVEMAVCELLQRAEGDKFKEILKLIK